MYLHISPAGLPTLRVLRGDGRGVLRLLHALLDTDRLGDTIGDVWYDLRYGPVSIGDSRCEWYVAQDELPVSEIGVI